MRRFNTGESPGAAKERHSDKESAIAATAVVVGFNLCKANITAFTFGEKDGNELWQPY